MVAHPGFLPASTRKLARYTGNRQRNRGITTSLPCRRQSPIRWRHPNDEATGRNEAAEN